VHLLVNELYRYQNAQYKDKKKERRIEFRCHNYCSGIVQYGDSFQQHIIINLSRILRRKPLDTLFLDCLLINHKCIYDK